MSRAPLERLLTSSAIQLNATAADSGDGLMWANTSFLAAVWAKAGARPLARMPASPAAPAKKPRRLWPAVRACFVDFMIPSRGLRSIDAVRAQYDFGNPSPFSAMKQR